MGKLTPSFAGAGIGRRVFVSGRKRPISRRDLRVRCLAVAAAAAVLAAGACGGTLEDDYRRNQPTRGSGPTTTQNPTGDSQASLTRRAVRLSRARPQGGSAEPVAAPAAPPAGVSRARSEAASVAPTAAPGGPAPPAPAPAQVRVAPAPGAPPLPLPVTDPPPTEEGVTATIVVMGGALPLSGPLGAIGRQELYGFDARVQRINDAGGIHGRRIKLVVHDDSLDPGRDRALFRRLVETDHVFAAFAAGSVRAVTDYICGDVARARGTPLPLVADVATMPEPQVAPHHRCILTTGPGTRHAA